jgi:hypothetical protein
MGDAKWLVVAMGTMATLATILMILMLTGHSLHELLGCSSAGCIGAFVQ